jgi:hypothetical protein
MTARRPSARRAAALAALLGVAAVVAATATAIGMPRGDEAASSVVEAARQELPPVLGPAADPGVTTGLPEPPGTTERVSVADDEGQANGASGGANALLPGAKPNQAVSADGRFVAFVSAAPNLIPGDPRGPGSVYIRDRETGTTVAIPWINGREFPSGVVAAEPTVSLDGNVVAFTVIVSGGIGGIVAVPTTTPYVVAWDRLTNATELVSIDGTGRAVPGWQPSISADGRFVAYTMWAPSNPPVPSNPTANPINLAYAPCGPTSSTISVTVTDPEDDVSNVTLFYSPSGGGTFSTGMAAGGGNTWQATIAIGSGWNTGQITYWVRATDSQGNTSSDVFPNSSNILTLHTCIL